MNKDRIGSIVCWSAHDVSADAVSLSKRMSACRRSFTCPACNAIPWTDCDPNSPFFEGEFCSVRAKVLAGRVRNPVKDSAAMTRAIARQRKGDNALFRKGESAGDLESVVLVIDEDISHEVKAGAPTQYAVETLVLDVSTGKLILPEKTEHQDRWDRLIRRFERERSSLTAQDVSKILTGLCLDLSGFSVNSGGTYFIPKGFDEVMESLREHNVFGPAGYRLQVYEVSHGREDSLRDIAQEHLLDQARDISEKAKAAKEKMERYLLQEQSGKPRASTLMRALSEIETLRMRARSYRLALNAETNDMEAVLSDAVDMVNKAMAGCGME